MLRILQTSLAFDDAQVLAMISGYHHYTNRRGARAADRLRGLYLPRARGQRRTTTGREFEYF